MTAVVGPLRLEALDEAPRRPPRSRVPLTEERRWLHEAEAVHPVGCGYRELECHGSGVRAAQHVGALDAEGVEELVAVTGVALDGSRSVHRAAAAVAAAVEKHDPVVIAQVGVVRKGDELVGEQRCLDQHERLSGAPDLDVEDGVRDRDEVTCSVGVSDRHASDRHPDALRGPPWAQVYSLTPRAGKPPVASSRGFPWAEAEGFEPSMGLDPNRISSAAP